MIAIRETVEPASSSNPLTCLAAALVESHRHGTLVAGPAAGDVVLSRHEVLNVQTIVARTLGAAIAGWKIAVRPPSEIVFAPIYKGRTIRSATSYRCPFPGPIQIEIEIALVVTKTDQGGALAVNGMTFGLELLRSRLVNPDHAPFWAFHSDNLGNDGYVLLRLPYSDTGSQLPLEIGLGGTIAWTGAIRHPLGDPTTALSLLTPIIGHHLGGLQPGQFITTGNVCPTPLTIESSTTVTVSIGEMSDSVDIVIAEDMAC